MEFGLELNIRPLITLENTNNSNIDDEDFIYEL